jgi:hypothetical protein
MKYNYICYFKLNNLDKTYFLEKWELIKVKENFK